MGLELELWVVDDHGRIADSCDVADAHERIEPEFVDPLLEVHTEPHESEAGLRRDLQELLAAAIDAAEGNGRHLVPLGTPLTTARPPATTDRGATFERIYGDGILPAKNCAGTHVHFEKGNVVEQLRLLTALDPALSLVSSSPYYCSERGMDSARAHAYRNGCGESFRRYCGLWSYPETVSEWRERVDTVYELFCSIAEDRGVPRSTVHEQFSPEDTVLNPVRLREEQPTVEWRAPDATLPSQLLQLASDVRELVGRVETTPVVPGARGVDEDSIGVPTFSTLREIGERAIRSGVESAPVRSYLRSLEFDVDAYEPISQQLRGPPTLSESEARKLRLEYARRLREDVAGLTEVSPADLDEREVQQTV